MFEQMPPPAVEIAMVDPNYQNLFGEAIEAIQCTLSEDDRGTFRHYADINSMLDDLRSRCTSSQNEQRRLLGCHAKMSSFAHALAAYFNMSSNLVEGRLDWLGWFLGSVALTFKAGSHYLLFLEKACDMFNTIARDLAQYGQIQPLCKEHFEPAQQDGLTFMLSYVYADIVTFCLELYCMFSRGFHGAKLRHRGTHVLWRPLDSRFAQLQQRLSRHRKWLEESASATNLQNGALIAQRQKEYLDLVNSQQESSGESEVEEQRMARRMRRIDKVKSWLSNCCAYRDLYEHRRRQRHSNSCSWFLQTPEYTSWKNAPFDDRIANDTDSLDTTWHDRILFVQAEAGFGKTFLSSQVIDDLSAEAEDLNISDEPPTTAFFHFNAAHLYCTHPNDAFRALAAQLVHTHRHNRPTLDALSLLVRQTSSQQVASSDDVLEVLSLLLRQHFTFLVIDGVDECSDVELFLTLLPQLCRKSDTRVLLFTRPGLNIPLEYQKWASDCPHIMTLNTSHNAIDIEQYMIDNLTQLADQGYFGTGIDKSIFPQIASRSNGSFLWASLLLKYVQAPELQPNERRVSLEQAHLLEGLDSLYRLILIALDRKRPKEKRMTADIFRWLASSIKRLCIPQLQTALGITSGRASTEDLFLSNLTESVPRLTYNLVEVTNSSVLFAHRSVKDYLQSAECQDSEFSLFDDGLVHGHLAARCLSYLANDIPRRPLQRLHPYIRPAPQPPIPSGSMSVRTGSSRDSGYKSMSSASDTDVAQHEAQQAPTFDVNMPFLRYAALCWPIHLTRALANPAPRPSSTPNDPFAYTPWLPSLSQFLMERSSVTTWVEASWRYSLPPNLSRILPPLITIKSEVPPATVEGRELRWVVHGLRQLSEALNELRGEYGTTLRENPSLIWQADTEGGFWPVWDERRGCVRGTVS